MISRWLASILPSSGCFSSSPASLGIGGSCFLAGGCDFGALDKCFLIRVDFDISVIILPLTRFLGSLRWCLIALFCVWEISLFQILSFYLFMAFACSGENTLW
ncbi:hypothetical protein F2Q69_00002564 [Brassica cretica]|uniref:Uncharacterized protein n=1 Tax=Brassica cretica TaxID=69181 RepID=A0A8S9P3P4_BRACR|nr:hypothetical protein F2Q69_00002564 [Brassica cretica]